MTLELIDSANATIRQDETVQEIRHLIDIITGIIRARGGDSEIAAALHKGRGALASVTGRRI